MSLLEAILMGVIQGVTEFLPVSSSGHLALFKILFHVETETGMLFDVLLHLGTLLAVLAVFYKDIFRMIWEGVAIIGDFFKDVGIFAGNFVMKKDEPYYRLVDNSYRKFVMLVVVSTIPTGIIGYIGADVVEAASGVLLAPGICLVLTAVLLVISDYVADGTKMPRNVTYSNAFFIGICQGFATLPGLSRSGTTISVCLLSKFNRKFAVKYSFIMSIPAILGAVVLKLTELSDIKVTASEIGCYAAGVACSAIVGYICIKTMLVVVKKKKFTYFAIYCLFVGIISIVGHFVVKL
ncbi:MAG: undecaprenyl-diphosphate phosphatase [Lachnospiraceae bacterium]|nr:undecaprenyl-diphosphate phosphatase [Lachnospiraceae bacterium]